MSVEPRRCAVGGTVGTWSLCDCWISCARHRSGSRHGASKERTSSSEPKMALPRGVSWTVVTAISQRPLFCTQDPPRALAMIWWPKQMPGGGAGEGMRWERRGSDTEYLQGRLLDEDARDVCDQLVDPLGVLVGGHICNEGMRSIVIRGQRRTRAGDQETVVMGVVGRVLHAFDDVVAIEGKGDLCAGSAETAGRRCRRRTRGDPCERRGQEVPEYPMVVAMDGLDGWNCIVADEQGECSGHGGAVFAACPTSTMSEVVNALVALAVIVFIFRWATSGRSCPPPRCSHSPPPSAPSPSSHSPSAIAALGFRPKHVTQEMVPPIHPRPTHHSPPRPGRPDPHHVPRHPDVRTRTHPHPHSHPRPDLTPPPDPETTSASTSCAQAASSSLRTRFSSAGSSSRYVPSPPFFFFFGVGRRSHCPLDQPPPAYFTLYPRQDGPSDQRRPPTGQNPTSASATTARQPSLIERYHLAQKISGEPNAHDHALADAGGKARWEDTPEKREASLRERKAQMVLAARQ